MQKKFKAVVANILLISLIFYFPVPALAVPAPLEPVMTSPTVYPSTADDNMGVPNQAPSTNTTDFLLQTNSLGIAEISCTTTMCGVTSGETLSGTVFIQPNLTMNPDIRKVAYYLNGTRSGREYTSPFTWGGTAGFDTTTLSDGNYTLGGAYTTQAGDNSFSISFTVDNSTPDTTPPVISAVSSTNIASNGATINWTTDEASDSQVQYRVQGATTWTTTNINTTLTANHSLTLTGLSPNTTYEFQAKSKDQAGNLATQTTLSALTTTTPDTTAPAISAVASSNVTSIGATISWTTNEVSDSQVEFRVQGATAWSATSVNASLVTSHSVALTGLSASTTYEFQVKSKDQAGNLTTQATISNLTTTTPATGDFAGVTEGATVSGVVNIGPNLTVHPGVRKVAFYLNGTKSGKVYSSPFYWGGVNGDGTAGFDTRTLADGNYALSMGYTDSTGDHAATVSFIVSNATPDTTPPVISAVSSTGVTSTGATINWTTNEAGNSQVEYRVQGATTWTATNINATLATNHSVELSGLNANTTYEFQTKSKDQAGNLATQTTISNFTTPAPAPVDTTAPVISAVSSTNVTSTEATINWTTNEASDSQVQYRIQGVTTWLTTTTNASLVTNHSVALTGLNASTTYEFQVKSKDQAGNLATQPAISNLTTNTLSTGDFSGVTGGATVKGVVNIGPNLTQHPNIQKVSYYLDGRQSGKVYTSPYLWGGLSGDGTTGFDTRTITDGSHTLSMGYSDNTGDHAAAITFNVNNTVDGTPFPVISALDIMGISASKATIIWTTNEPSDSQVEFRVQGNTAWSNTNLDTSSVINHWVELTGLSANTIYEYRVKSRDPDGNLTTQATISSLTTRPLSADTTTPKISNVLSSNITSTGATVNWMTDEASDSRVRYRAQGAGTWIYSILNPSMGTSHSVVLTGLTAGTIYELQTFSKDPSGNLIAQETLSHLTTADLISPTKLLGIAPGDTVTGVINIRPDLSAFGAIQQVRYYVDGVNRGSSTGSPFTWLSDGNSQGFASRLLTNTPHILKAVVTDSAGNHEINLNFTAYNTDIPPSTVFVGITPGATVSGVVNIGVDLAANPSIRKVQYYLDFSQSGKVYTSPYLWGGVSGDGTVGFDTRTISNIPHMLIMFYTDSTGDHEGRIDFIVNN